MKSFAPQRWMGFLLLATLIVGCDTTARITFVKEKLSGALTVLGFRADDCAPGEDPLTMCEPPGCGQIDFVMETTVGRFLTPNLQIIGLDGRLTPGVNFGTSSEDLTFQRAWLFQLGEQGLDVECSVAADCASGFECRALTDGELPSDSANIGRSLCVRRAQVTPKVGSLAYRAMRQDPQPENPATSAADYRGLSLILNLDNSGSLLGRDEDSGNIDRMKATDPSADRIAAVVTFLSELTADGRSGIVDSTEYGVFELAGTSSNGVINLFNSDQAINGTFVGDVGHVRDTVQLLQGRSIGQTPVWESYIAAAIAFSSADDNASSSYARRVLTVVDSGADGSSDGRTVDNAIAALEQADVDAVTTILHLDSLAPQDAERTGPNGDYARLACETGGYYLYETYPESLEDHLRRQGVGYEGIWSLEVEVMADNTPLSELPIGWYRLAAAMQVNLAQESATYRFQIRKAKFTDETFDSRLLFHVQAQ